VALEEAELVAPGPVRPAAPPRRVPDPQPAPPPGQEQDHDPHRNLPGGLPASVLIGLALLPFAIPILWLVAPAVLGQAPTLSPAVPVALAVSTSILCLAVIYTIDWSPATRVKGVLMMVVLAYFAAVNLYFLRKQTVDEVKKFFGVGPEWVGFTPLDNTYTVSLPADPHAIKDQPLTGLAQLNCYKASHRAFVAQLDFVVGSGPPQGLANGPGPGTDPWFELAAAKVRDHARGQLRSKDPIQYQNSPGYELVIERGSDVRIVRLFVIKDRVYYLAVESQGRPDSDLVEDFFNSFTAR
jgi:hypothetical protein